MDKKEKTQEQLNKEAQDRINDLVKKDEEYKDWFDKLPKKEQEKIRRETDDSLDNHIW